MFLFSCMLRETLMVHLSHSVMFLAPHLSCYFLILLQLWSCMLHFESWLLQNNLLAVDEVGNLKTKLQNKRHQFWFCFAEIGGLVLQIGWMWKKAISNIVVGKSFVYHFAVAVVMRSKKCHIADSWFSFDPTYTAV